MPETDIPARSRRSLGWALVGGAIVTETIGSLAMKAALQHPALYAITAVGYIAAFAMLAGALRAGMPLGAAYGIWGACGVASTAVLSAVLFGEALTPVMALGVVVVMAGVLCVELGAQQAARRKRSG